MVNCKKVHPSKLEFMDDAKNTSAPESPTEPWFVLSIIAKTTEAGLSDDDHFFLLFGGFVDLR